jgi:hypothetical protein
MAKRAAPNKQLAQLPPDGDDLTPAVPGIVQPFLVPMAGHEGARAVYEYRAMAEGRITPVDRDCADDQDYKFRDYGQYLTVIDGLGGDNTDKESGDQTRFVDEAGMRRMPHQPEKRPTTVIGARKR